MKKMTKKEMFSALSAYIAGEKVKVSVADMQAFIAHEQELLAKKSVKSGEKKLTASQVANEGFKADIYEKMEMNREYSCTEIGKMCGFEGSQKASALLRQMKDAGQVERTEVKGKPFYHKIAQ